MSYSEIAGTKKSTPDTHSVEYRFEDQADISDLLTKGSRAPWTSEPAIISNWSVNHDYVGGGGTVTVQATNNSDAVNNEYNPFDPDTNFSISCSDSEKYCQMKWWGVRRATADDIEKYQSKGLKNIHGKTANKDDYIYKNALTDTQNGYQGSADYTESVFWSEDNLHPSIKWIEEPMPTKTVNVAFFSDKKLKKLCSMHGVMSAKAWPSYAKDNLWNLGYRWRYVSGSLSTQKVNGKLYINATRTFEYLHFGYWNPDKNGGTCTSWES